MKRENSDCSRGIDRLLQLSRNNSTGPIRDGDEFTIEGVERGSIIPLQKILSALEALGYVEKIGERLPIGQPHGGRHKIYKFLPGSTRELRRRRALVLENQKKS